MLRQQFQTPQAANGGHDLADYDRAFGIIDIVQDSGISRNSRLCDRGCSPTKSAEHHWSEGEWAPRTPKKGKSPARDTLHSMRRSRSWSRLFRFPRSLGSLLSDPRTVGTSTLAMSGAICALLGVAILPFLTDLYSPDSYAVFAVAAALVSALCVVVTGRYEQAIPLVRRDDGGGAAANELALVALISSLLSCLLGEALVLVSMLLGWLTEGPMKEVVLALPLLTFLASLGGIQSMILTSTGRYNAMAVFQVIRVLSQLVMQVLLGHWDAGIGSLLLGFGLGLLPSGFHVMRLVSLKGVTPVAELARTAVNHRHMPIYQVPVTLIRGLEGNALLFTLAIAYGNDLVGLFALASRVLLGPGVILASSVNTVFLHEGVHLSRAGQSAFMKKTLYLMLGVFALVCMLVLLLARPAQELLGSQWVGAATVTIASLPLLGASLIGAVPSTALLIAGRSRELLLWRITLIVLPCATIVASGFSGRSGVAAIALAGLTQLLAACVLHWHAARLIDAKPTLAP